MRVSLLILSFCLLDVRIQHAEGANILFYCGHGAGSLFTTCASLGKELVHRGHNVTALISNAYLERSTDPKYSQLNFAVFNHTRPVENVYALWEWFGKAAMTGHFYRELFFNTPPALNMEKADLMDCDAILDKNVTHSLTDVQFDAIIIEPMFGCAVFLGDIIGAKRLVLFSTGTLDLDLGGMIAGAPNRLALNPSYGTGLPSPMIFQERVFNVLLSQITPLSKVFLQTPEKYRRERGLLSGMTLAQRYDRADLYLVNIDFAMEYPAAITPKMIPVGGVTTAPSRPLEADLEDFVQGSGEHGVIVFSFGSYLTQSFREEFVLLFANAFAQLPQRVVWHWRGDVPSIIANQPNIKTMKWIPQNDLLGHNKTKVLLYHGGNAGCYEALYHGVPVVVTPVFVDQHDVASRFVSRGMGIALDINDLSTEKVVAALRAVIDDKKYKEAAMRQSDIFHDLPMAPAERASFWIEHVIKHGGDYMRSPANDLTWWQYHLLDVVAFLLSIAFVSIMCIFYACKWCFTLCRRGNRGYISIDKDK